MRSIPSSFNVSIAGVLLLVMAVTAGSLGVVAQDAPESPLEIAINDVSGAEVGTATFTENDDATITVAVETDGLPPGEHGIHIHAMGNCDPGGDQPFTTAGPHYNPTGGMHGDAPMEDELATPGGDPTIHAGDFANLTVEDDGTGSVELTTPRFSLASGPTSLFDMDGSSLVIHANADDLESQPSGDSGGRIACGVVAAPMEEAPASPEASAAAVSVENNIVNPEQIPFSEDLLAQLDVPEGFEISVYSQGLDNPRMMAFGPDGTLYVTEPAANSVVALRDTDDDGQVDETVPAISNLPYVHGILFHEGSVFLAGEKQVWTSAVADDGTFGEPEVVLDNLPDGDQHGRRTIAIGPDGLLYVALGSSCNSCVETNPENATIIRSDLDGSNRETFAKGLRNTLGWDWHPETDALWGWDQGSDHRGGDQPPEELNQIVESGNYGWPYCFGDQEPDVYQPYVPSGATSDQYCANTQAPVLPYQAHSSPIGFLFYEGDQFPAEYQGDGFVAMRGSWNRDPVVGYELVYVDFENGQPVSAEPFISGWLLDGGAGHFGRIAGLVVTPDGSMLLSDDANGVIYEITYTG